MIFQCLHYKHHQPQGIFWDKKPVIRENRELRIYLFHLEMPRLCQVRRGLFTFPRHETFGWWTNQIIKFTAGPQTIRVRQDLSFQVTHHTSKGLQFCQVEGKLWSSSATRGGSSNWHLILIEVWTDPSDTKKHFLCWFLWLFAALWCEPSVQCDTYSFTSEIWDLFGWN